MISPSIAFESNVILFPSVYDGKDILFLTKTNLACKYSSFSRGSLIFFVNDKKSLPGLKRILVMPVDRKGPSSDLIVYKWQYVC